MKSKNWLLRLSLVICLALGWAAYLPAVAPRVALAENPFPPAQEVERAVPVVLPAPPTPSPEEVELRTALEALELALQQGPEAVMALGRILHGKALDLAMRDVVEAQRQLALAAPSRPATALVSPAEEKAALQAQAELDAASRARALAHHAERLEDQTPDDAPQATTTPNAANAPSVDRTVGSAPCTYATITAAMLAANDGDRLLLEGEVSFPGNLSVHKSLTFQGGYAGCGSGSSALTTIDAGGTGRGMYIYDNLNVTLENLNVINATTAAYGAGIFVYTNTNLIGTNLNIYSNTTTALGGGVFLWGARATFSETEIYNNIADVGAGVYGALRGSYAPSLNLASYADVNNNDALTGSGFGGGVYMSEGIITITNSSDIYSNHAIEGGGVYLISSTLTVEGLYSEIMYNTATVDGGGIRALGSVINLDQDAELFHNSAGTDGSGNGGGAYLDGSDLWGDKSSIYHNTADDYGGGVYATNNSLVDMDLGSYACAGPRCSQLSYNTATNMYGGGVYASDSSEVDLRQIFVEGNSADRGGGVYASASPVYLYNSLIAHNDASGGTGDGLRLYTGSTLSGAHNTFAYNNAGGAATGQAINMAGATLTLGNTIIWGHTTSINDAGQIVTYSDIQGGYTGTGNLDVDPLFIDPASANFHLQSLSPVIDRCAAGQSEDFDNEPRPITYIRPATPYDMGADEASGRVGINGAACAYGRIQDAVDAAVLGDTIQAVADVFSETVDVTKTLTIVGGYDTDCTTYITGTTTVNGGGAGSVFDITGGTVVLRNLQITGGSDIGAGVDVDGVSQVTLDVTKVTGNNGLYGGGIYVGANAVVTLTNDSDITYNTASSAGGGARVWGKLVGDETLSDIEYNAAPDGGGVSVPGGVLILKGSDLRHNQATGATGRGGGIHIYQGGVVTTTNNVWIYEGHTAYDGAGIYADDATLYLDYTTIREGVAANYGGGVYLANGSTLYASEVDVGYAASNAGNEAIWGAGLYVDASTVNFSGNIINNVAATLGGGVYAANSTVNLTDAHVGGTGDNEANRIGASGLNGGGLYLTLGTHATLQNTVVSSNTLTNPSTGYGGGLYVRDSSVVTLTNSRIERHVLPSTFDGRGAGIYVYSSTVTLDNSAVLSNTAGTAGGGIRLFEGGILNILNGSELRNNHALSGEGGAVAGSSSGVPDINISDSTLQDNSASTDGGAVYLSTGTLDFTGWWNVRDNTAGGNGGAVAVTGTGDVDFSATDAGSSILYNQAGGDGGALHLHNADTVQLHSTSGYLLSIGGNQASGNGGAAFADGGGYFDVYGRVVATANSASGNGGVFYLSGGSKVWLDDYTNDVPELRENSAQNGGAIYAQNSPRVECDGAVFGTGADGNRATAGSGGAVYLSGSIFSADNCTFLNNQAQQNGGAIAAYTSTLDIYATYPAPTLAAQPSGVERALHSTAAPASTSCDPLTEQCSAFRSNVADSNADDTGDGGAIYTNDSTLRINHTYLHRNSAYHGGAIYQTGANAAAQVANSLIYSNTVSHPLGAGIRRSGGAFTVTHVTLANNIGGAGFSGVASVVTNTIAWGNEMGGFTITPTLATCNIDESSYSGVNMDPQFISPGAGENYRLRGSSSAIDACATGLPLDLDNKTRPIGDLFDMGAYEGAGEVYIYLPLVLRNHTD